MDSLRRIFAQLCRLFAEIYEDYGRNLILQYDQSNVVILFKNLNYNEDDWLSH